MYSKRTVLVFRHDSVTQSKQSKEHMYMWIAGFDCLPKLVVVEPKVWLIHRIVGKINFQSSLWNTEMMQYFSRISLSR